MASRQLENSLKKLITLANEVTAGHWSEVEQVLAMAGDRGLPPQVSELAEALSMLVVQVEARQYHLSCIIADLERTQSELERANYDNLTGLPNRAIFHDRLRKAVAGANATAQVMAVLFVDLDHFKVVNDTLGHRAGDELLQVVAARIQRCVRSEDIVARLGGDEFTVIMPAVRSEQDATDIAQRIIVSLAKPVHLNAGEAEIGASIGIAILPTHADTPERLLQSADIAMYRAKATGRSNYQVYHPDIELSTNQEH
ncbi:MAG: GGDEF domain-containing protein [Rhodospirillaceae bacterium]